MFGELSGCLGSLVGVWGVEWVFGELAGCLGSWVGVWGVG